MQNQNSPSSAVFNHRTVSTLRNALEMEEQKEHQHNVPEVEEQKEHHQHNVPEVEEQKEHHQQNIPEAELNKFREFWWKTGNFHPKAHWYDATLPYVLKTNVTLDDYIIQTDKHNIKGFWEWEKDTVRVIEFPSRFHEVPVQAISMELSVTFYPVRDTSARKEPDGSFRPSKKPPTTSNGYDGKNFPWPNLIVEVAYAQEERMLKERIENYWLLPNRVHDAIGIKLEYTKDESIPTEMT
ncbi:4008_t:CDS:2, partial [Racocetra fulgida]